MKLLLFRSYTHVSGAVVLETLEKPQRRSCQLLGHGSGLVITVALSAMHGGRVFSADRNVDQPIIVIAFEGLLLLAGVSFDSDSAAFQDPDLVYFGNLSRSYEVHSYLLRQVGATTS
jgi:hypothetical protein